MCKARNMEQRHVEEARKRVQAATAEARVSSALGLRRALSSPARPITHSTRVNLIATCSRVSRFSASTTKPKLPLLMSLIFL